MTEQTATKLDPRRNVVREDLAAESLKDKVKAQRYAPGELRQIVGSIAPVRIVPRFDAPLLTQALYGELATIYEISKGWAWVQLENDGYVGYMPADNISAIIEEPTHWVAATGTFVYPAPDLKRPPITRLSFSAKLTIIGREGRFAELSRGGFVFIGHLKPFEEKAKDFVTLAENLNGTPYLWGGRSDVGIDCSALVQLSMQAMGLTCPRDTDMQEREVGEKLPDNEIKQLERGDLIFWRGHVGIAQSASHVVHSSGHQMQVVSETIASAVERIAATHGNITSIKRIPALKLG
jgi:cell wall-associated NlpC family hydrolase